MGMALLISITGTSGCDFANIRDDAAVADTEGHRVKRIERVKKTREFAASEVIGKMLITNDGASLQGIFL